MRRALWGTPGGCGALNGSAPHWCLDGSRLGTQWGLPLLVDRAVCGWNCRLHEMVLSEVIEQQEEAPQAETTEKLEWMYEDRDRLDAADMWFDGSEQDAAERVTCALTG
eukprot:gene13459-57673_t